MKKEEHRDPFAKYGFLLGVNYWPRKSGVRMWKEFDAAEIDGCGELYKFARIALPLSLPAMGTVSIFAFFNTFNDYLWQLIMISDKALKTLPIGIAMFSEAQTTNKGAQLAVGLISTIPLIIMFILFQRFFIKGATDGAIKN